MAFLAAAAPILGAVGAGVSAIGTLEQGQASANMANYQAAVARNNAVIANQNADYAIAAGTAKAEATSLKGAAMAGRIKAAQAANGVDVNTGSAADVQEGQRETDKLSTETEVNNAQLKAYGYRTQATNFNTQAGLDETQASQAKTASYIGAVGSLLGNASSLSTKWTGFGSNSDTGVSAYNSGAPVY